jgi:hypothetical protein
MDRPRIASRILDGHGPHKSIRPRYGAVAPGHYGYIAFSQFAGAALARPGQTGWGPQSLAPVYGWFTEGFDTLDLKEAKALLDELAA